MSFYDVVYEQVKKIPGGKVATYGQIAALCGSPRASRAVGYALHFNPDPEHIPCFRVVNRFGRCAPAFAFGGPKVQANLLRADGIEVDKDGYVDLDKYQWNPYHTETKDDYISQLQRLKQLLDAGVITQQEFDEKKKTLLK